MSYTQAEWNELRDRAKTYGASLGSDIEDCWIYLHHTDEYLWIPVMPESIKDDMGSTFSTTTALGRTAPVFSYSYSGPRTVSFQFDLHRELLDAVNHNNSNIEPELSQDYTDALIERLQSIALPKYSTGDKSIVPPMVSVKVNDMIFIKGVVTSSISVGYAKPILSNGKYASVSISFTVSEVDPYDAKAVESLGSFRGITRSFMTGIGRE